MANARRGLIGHLAVVAVAATVAAAGCGSDDRASESGDAVERPTIVVTTSIMGDVVNELVGDQANVVTIMPPGADPHEFQPSAQEVDRLLEADALIVNGHDFEEGLLDVVESAVASGVSTFEATSAVDVLDFADNDSGHSDEGDHEDDHDHEGVDPHFFTDPARMADAVRGLSSFLETEVAGLDRAALRLAVDDYLTRLEELDEDVMELVSAVPEEGRVLVTDHEVFGYFADRYGFELVGAVIPGGTTVDAASAAELAELAELVESEGVPAIFSASSSDLVDALAAEAGEVAVIELYAESLGPPGIRRRVLPRDDANECRTDQRGADSALIDRDSTTDHRRQRSSQIARSRPRSDRGGSVHRCQWVWACSWCGSSSNSVSPTRMNRPP